MRESPIRNTSSFLFAPAPPPFSRVASLSPSPSTIVHRRLTRTPLSVRFVDSEDAFFLSRIAKLGWVHVNHVDFATAARFGGWYPDMLDAVLLSRAVGFVGFVLRGSFPISLYLATLPLAVTPCGTSSKLTLGVLAPLRTGCGSYRTRMSTFSHLAARRVESWNQGITTIVG